MTTETLRIAPTTMKDQFDKILRSLEFPDEKANTLARIFMENSLDGVYTHGVNRFPEFVEYVRKGFIRIDGEPECVHVAGGVEQWNGNAGPGILNALRCADRAMEIARKGGIGCVALANTNHWMRGGTYAWRVAKAGFVYIGWTNTIANMPPWGATEPRLGNNPLVIGVPYQDEAIVLDMALSQYSVGALKQKKMTGELLAVPGGYDREGKPTHDPAAILETQRILPAGYWKGAGLSLLLDILATALSNGQSVARISAESHEHGLSQVFMAISLDQLSNYSTINKEIGEILAHYKAAATDDGQGPVLYPGERVLRVRQENQEGIPVLASVWERIIAL
ncbi:MAG TPA: 3-dehydro-L-gulonate 2-dehydrogenase [Cyclobacteriaceae bacterium]|nr:3-dehydro-L-gulonate 2-dehydrogenase [Cyclobacteriaceae bacterium]